MAALMAVVMVNTSCVVQVEDPTPRAVKYTVRGGATMASLTYQNESGGTEQKDVVLPWPLAFHAKQGAFVYLSVQKKFESANLEAVITVNGKILQQAESTPPYGIASVSGSVP